MRHRWLTKDQFAAVLLDMVNAYNRLGFAEPIPFPGYEQIDIAGSIVASANEPVYGYYPYPSITSKVAFVFYELIKQHVFLNGNKRVATYFLLHLLEIHGYMLDIDEVALAEFAKWVAQTDPKDRDRILKHIDEYIADHLETLESWRFLRWLRRKK